MSIVEWFYVIFSVGLACAVLSFPYLIEKLVRVIKNGIGVDDER
jgi:hypothetical protein